MITLAIYDMDKTVTRRPTYGRFLLHAALSLSPWRLLLMPAMAATDARLWAAPLRSRPAQGAQLPAAGRKVAPERLEPVVQSFADRELEHNIMAGARARIAEDKAAGRRLVMATASYRLYAAAIAAAARLRRRHRHRLASDREGRIVARIDGRNCYGLAKLDMIEAWLQRVGSSATRSTSASIPTTSPTRRSTTGRTRPSPPTPMLASIRLAEVEWLGSPRLARPQTRRAPLTFPPFAGEGVEGPIAIRSSFPRKRESPSFPANGPRGT
jgi:phosphoserine phosphatase